MAYAIRRLYDIARLPGGSLSFMPRFSANSRSFAKFADSKTPAIKTDQSESSLKSGGRGGHAFATLGQAHAIPDHGK